MVDFKNKYVYKTLWIFIFIGQVVVANANEIAKPLLIKGTLNLNEYSFENKRFDIGGEAFFFWNEFYSLNDIENGQFSADTIDILHSWDNQNDHFKDLSAKGFGTYYFKIIIPEKYIGSQFIIRSNHFISYASEIYVNNSLVTNNGSVGKSKNDKNYSPSRKTISRPFTADSSVLEVVVWVANHDHFRGGIFNRIQFSLAPTMIAQHERAILYDLAIIISLLIMFLYHFILYFVNPKGAVALYFSITCLFFAIDFSFQDTMAFFLFFPDAGFRLTSFLHLSMPYLLPSSFIFFLYSLFPNETSKILRNITISVSVILTTITFFFSSEVTIYIAKPHLIYVFALILYIYYVAIKAVINKKEGALLFLVAYIVFSLCAINDILFVFEVVYTASLVSTGLMVFVLLLSILQGNRMVVMVTRNKNLSESLQYLNISLENKVRERTTELNNSLHQLQQLNMFKEDMTNMVVHDLKAPLSTIINVKHLNNEDGLNLVQQAGYKMLNLVQNILGVYRSENAGFELRLKENRISDIIGEAYDEVKLLAEQKSVRIAFNKDARCSVKTDEDILRRIFVNLLSNAIKFSPSGGLIKIQTQVSLDNLAKIAVINQGPPIPAEKQSLIFERFGQSEKRQTGTIGSTGLGLTFCKMAVEAHGGQIGVYSEPNKEVEFWFTLPATDTTQIKDKTEDDGKTSLTPEEKKYLAPFIAKLNNYKVFEVTAINKVLNDINNESPNIKLWLKMVEEQIYSGDVESFDNLMI